MELQKIVLSLVCVLALALLLFLLLTRKQAEDEMAKEKPESSETIVRKKLGSAMLRHREGSIASRDPAWPAGGYQDRPEELRLLNPSLQEFDQSLRDLCASFAAIESAEDRAALRKELHENKHVLMNFARRSAVFAIRENDAAILRDGLRALAMIDATRIDYRDVLVVIAMLRYSVERLGADLQTMFEEAASVAEPRMAELLLGFLDNNYEGKDLSKPWGFREVELESGIGFAASGSENYEPQQDLLAFGLDIASVVNDDPHYSADQIEVATKLSGHWFSTDREAAEQILANSRAGMLVRGKFDDPEQRHNYLTIFTVELDSAESAQALLDLSKRAKLDGEMTLGFVQDSVFSLLVARSYVKGEVPFEKEGSIERFILPLEAAMARLQPSDR